MSKAVKHLQAITKNDLWETPQDMFREANHAFEIGAALDVCATAKNAKCSYWFDEKTNGLTQEWDRNFFMNPPYSQVALWVAKADKQVRKHKVKALILTYAKTDTRWWHRYIEWNPYVETHFIKGRVKFWWQGKPGKLHAPYPSVWIVMRP